jgi:hypothetical protein
MENLDAPAVVAQAHQRFQRPSCQSLPFAELQDPQLRLDQRSGFSPNARQARKASKNP